MGMNRPTGAAATINSAQASAGGKQKPASPGASPVGQERKADMGAAFSSNVAGGVKQQLSTLGSCVASMASDHPIAHYDHGPHHGTTHHQRHAPVDMSAVGVPRKR